MSVSALSANGTPRALSEIIVRDENNVPRTITEGWARDTALRQFWGGTAGGGAMPLVATADPSDVSGASSNGKPTSTNTTTVTATGGVAPYQYAWSEGQNLTPVSPASATTAFRGLPPAGESISDDFTCTVTDAVGATIQSNVVSATVYSFGGSSGQSS